MANVIRQSNLIVEAGIRDSFALRGNFIRVVRCSDPIHIFVNDSEVTLEEGEAVKFDEVFSRVWIEHDAVGDLAVTLRVGLNASDDSTKIGGSIVATPSASAGAATHAAVNVTNASAQIIAANASRKYLMIQNRDGAGVIYVNLNGAAATVGPGGNSIEIRPGDRYESTSAWISTAAITAIGSIAANANVLIVEGQ